MMKSTIHNEEIEAVIQSRLDCPGMVSGSVKNPVTRDKNPNRNSPEEFPVRAIYLKNT